MCFSSHLNFSLMRNRGIGAGSLTRCSPWQAALAAAQGSSPASLAAGVQSVGTWEQMTSWSWLWRRGGSPLATRQEGAGRSRLGARKNPLPAFQLLRILSQVWEQEGRFKRFALRSGAWERIAHKTKSLTSAT